MSLQGEGQESKRGPTKLWLPVVLASGVLVGLVLSYALPMPFGFLRFGGLPERFRDVLVIHMVLSTVSIALLVALAVVYVRVYAETHARFALGISIVLLALLIQSLIQYPLLLGLVGPFAAGQGSFLSFADLFTIAAYTIFLYLSLE
jgi:hypothetical protein